MTPSGGGESYSSGAVAAQQVLLIWKLWTMAAPAIAAPTISTAANSSDV
jgi:hypothetical protein